MISAITSENVISGTIFNALFLPKFVAKNDVLDERRLLQRPIKKCVLMLSDID